MEELGMAREACKFCWCTCVWEEWNNEVQGIVNRDDVAKFAFVTVMKSNINGLVGQIVNEGWLLCGTDVFQ